MGHIELSRDADLVVVAPATANLLAKMANGLADDLASTLLLATDKKILAAPAMNLRMWLHPATQRNVAWLREHNVTFSGPDDGEMACGEFGPGRMSEPLAIVAAMEAVFTAGDTSIQLPLGVGQRLQENKGPLAGRRVIVTSGPTHEPIDPVRYIANRSSGRQGYAIAAAAARLGARVTLISGPVGLADPEGVRVVRVETAAEMLAATEAALPADVGVFAAAVADWRIAEAAQEKIKKGKGGTPSLTLVENPDILKSIARRTAGRPALVVGFAAETERVVEHARAKRKSKGCDWIVANDVSPETGIMGGTRNTVNVITAEGVESWPEMDKDAVAGQLVARIAEHLTLGQADV